MKKVQERGAWVYIARHSGYQSGSPGLFSLQAGLVFDAGQNSIS